MASGGSTASGGVPATGGKANTGGSTAAVTGGATSAGGATGSGGTSTTDTTGCDLTSTPGTYAPDGGTPITAPVHTANTTYCPDNTLLGAACITTKGALGTMTSKCAAMPDTCGYLYCVAN